MMNFQSPFWPGMQGIADLPKQIETLTQNFSRFLQDKIPADATKPLEALTPTVEKMQPLVAELMLAHRKLWEQMLQQKRGEPTAPIVTNLSDDPPLLPGPQAALRRVEEAARPSPAARTRQALAAVWRGLVNRAPAFTAGFITGLWAGGR